MRKRSGQVHSRESSATLQLTVSLLYLYISFLYYFYRFYAILFIASVYHYLHSTRERIA